MTDQEEEQPVETVYVAFNEVENPTDSVTSYRVHFTQSAKMTYPIIFSAMFQHSLSVMDIAFVGQLGKHELAAATLAVTWFHLWDFTMTGFMQGFVAAPLSHLYGARRSNLEGFRIWAGNSFFVVFLTTCIISGIIALCGPFMHLVGQDPNIAHTAGIFSFQLIPGLFPYYAFKTQMTYLQTQNILSPAVWIAVLATICNAFFNWLLIFKAGLGIWGSPWATSLTRTLEFLVGLGYMSIKKKERERTWPQFSLSYLDCTAARPYYKLGISGAGIFFVSSLFFEAMTILAGLLGTEELGAHGITLSIGAFLFNSFPCAVGAGTSIRVGQFIGNQKIRDAKRSAHAFYLLSSLIELVLVIILMVSREELAHLFSSNDDVANLVAGLIPILCIIMIGDAIAQTTGGILRSLGRQMEILCLNVFALMIGLPVALLLAFPLGLNLFGLWWGMTTRLYVIIVFGVVILKFVDWKKETERTFMRISSISRLSSLIESSESLENSVIGGDECDQVESNEHQNLLNN